MIKYALALALMTAPAAAFAQTAQGPVTVEIVSSGQVVVQAKRFRFSVTVTGKGASEDAAGKALAANKGKLIQALAARNIREAQPDTGVPKSMASLFAAMGTRSKPSFSMDMMTDDTEKPESTATETLMFDAPSRVAVTEAGPTAETSGGKVSGEVLALLDDYVTPTRQAKADAVAKARGEAMAYATTLGLTRATIVKISEKQDAIAGSIGFISELIGMIMPKSGAASDTVPVQASITVEFQLTR
jgi:uncharacterized protein YggE